VFRVARDSGSSIGAVMIAYIYMNRYIRMNLPMTGAQREPFKLDNMENAFDLFCAALIAADAYVADDDMSVANWGA
jgi:hypothetical protein